MTWDPADAAAFRAAVSATLADFVDEQGARLAPLGPDAERLVLAAREAVAGGKRFRASFCWWGYRAVQYDVADEHALLRAAASLELLHASALVHDDFMDASDTRRGRPATHRAFEAEHRAAGWRGDAVQYGAAAAILLGDLQLGWAEDMLRHSGFSEAEVAPGLTLFERCRNEVIAGQFLDVSVQARGRADVDTAMTVLRYKSAKYSIERPIHIGAALAGASEGQLAQLGRFGLPLGEAFQLRDDLLGVFGTEEESGRPAGSDLMAGKGTTSVLKYALPRLRGADKRAVSAVWRRRASKTAVAAAVEAVESSGARDVVEKRLAALCTDAESKAEKLPLSEKARFELAGASLAIRVGPGGREAR